MNKQNNAILQKNFSTIVIKKEEKEEQNIDTIPPLIDESELFNEIEIIEENICKEKVFNSFFINNLTFFLEYFKTFKKYNFNTI